MCEQQQIEEILLEANAYGIREEVKKMAAILMTLAEKGAWTTASTKVDYYDFVFRLLTEKVK